MGSCIVPKRPRIERAFFVFDYDISKLVDDKRAWIIDENDVEVKGKKQATKRFLLCKCQLIFAIWHKNDDFVALLPTLWACDFIVIDSLIALLRRWIRRRVFVDVGRLLWRADALCKRRRSLSAMDIGLENYKFLLNN